MYSTFKKFYFLFFQGVGLKNDVVSVRPNFGRTKLLLPGLAVYASPENLEKLKTDLQNSRETENIEPLLHSSRFAELVNLTVKSSHEKLYL